MHLISLLTNASTLIIVVIILILMFSSCFHQKKSIEVTKPSDSDCSMEEIIKTYFDNEHWGYETKTQEDSTLSFYLSFHCKHELLHMRVDLNNNKNMFLIMCQPETRLPIESLNNGIIAMNNYNCQALFVTGCIRPEGQIVFWLARNIEGKAYSKEAFDMDLELILQVADEETAQIYKQACMEDTADL